VKLSVGAAGSDDAGGGASDGGGTAAAGGGPAAGGGAGVGSAADSDGPVLNDFDRPRGVPQFGQFFCVSSAEV
jgi:hypothetical protein